MTKAKQAATEANYAIVVEPLSEEDGGGWLASVPALPGCFGDGATVAEAVKDGVDAIEEWKDAARELGREIPGPDALGQWRQRVPRTLHEKLRRLAAAEGVSLNHLVATLLAEAVGKQAIDAAEPAKARAGSARALEARAAIEAARRLAKDVIEDILRVENVKNVPGSEITAAVNQLIESDPSYIEQAKANLAEAVAEVETLRKRGVSAQQSRPQSDNASKAAAARLPREERRRIGPKPSI